MSKAEAWRPGDGRSSRRDRVPLEMRILGRLLPLEPARVADTQPTWMSMTDLQLAVERASAVVRERVPSLCEPLRLSAGFYPQMARLPFGCLRRELLVPGTYFLLDSSPANRVLYVGSSVDSSVRSRLIYHLFENGRMFNAQRSFRRAVELGRILGFRSEEETDRSLRRSLWSRNRWLAKPQSLGGGQLAAAQLLGEGAFEVAMVAAPIGHELVARCLERYVTELVRQRCGWFPPLNDASVILDRRARLDSRITHAQAQDLFTALDRLARTSG